MDKLLKLLNLTASENDNEALSALRKAQQLMKKHNLNWRKLLSGNRAFKRKTEENFDTVTFTYGVDVFDFSFGYTRQKPSFSGKVSTAMTREQTLELYNFLKANINQFNLVDAAWIQSVAQAVLFTRDGQYRLYNIFHKYF